MARDVVGGTRPDHVAHTYTRVQRTHQLVDHLPDDVHHRLERGAGEKIAVTVGEGGRHAALGCWVWFVRWGGSLLVACKWPCVSLERAR